MSFQPAEPSPPSPKSLLRFSLKELLVETGLEKESLSRGGKLLDQEEIQRIFANENKPPAGKSR